MDNHVSIIEIGDVESLVIAKMLSKCTVWPLGVERLNKRSLQSEFCTDDSWYVVNYALVVCW